MTTAPPAAHAARPFRANRAAGPPRAARRAQPLTARRAASARPNPVPNPPPRARVGMRRPRIVRPSPLRGLRDQIARLSAAQTAIAGQRRPVQDRPVPNRPAQNLPPPNLLRPKLPDRAGQSRQAARARAKGGPIRGEETRRFPAWETGTMAGLCL